MNKKLIVGNWKMNPLALDDARKIFSSIKNISKRLNNTDIVICPPYLYIKPLIARNSVPNLKIGAQNVFMEEYGAFTGEISAGMLRDVGASYVIIGHSERRERGETDDVVARKVQVTLEYNLSPILCIGEKHRDAGGDYLNFIKEQLKNSLNKVNKKYISSLIIAYEPLWAIGAKDAMNATEVHEMSLFIKKVLSDMYGHEDAVATRVLYGGSVNYRNATDIISIGKVNGLLVGRESLNVPGFSELLRSIDTL